jgi:ribonuclease I
MMMRFLISAIAVIITIRTVSSWRDTGRQLENTGLQPYRIEVLWWPGYCDEHRNNAACMNSSRQQFVPGSLLPLVDGVAVSAYKRSKEQAKPFYPR